MMQLGTLVTIAGARAGNLTVVIMYDRSYATSGNQAIPGAETADLVGLARAAGFPTTYRTGDAADLRRNLEGLAAMPGPRMLLLDIAREEPAAQWPSVSMKQQIQDVRAHLTGGAG
jgi:hypothetical protein